MVSPLVPRRRVLQGLAAGGGLLMAGGLRIPLAEGAPRINQPGSRPNPSKPEGIDMLPQVEHIIIYMQENHSWDAYFGMLGRGDGFTLDGQGKPTNSNPDTNGDPVVVSPATTTCDGGGGSAGQNWNSTHKSINGGAMDGFARLDPNAMRYWDDSALPFYWGLANTFVLCDRWFASAPAQTHPNRRFLQAGTSFGMVKTSVQDVLDYPDAPNGVIWDRLNDHGISWTDYCYDLPDIALFPNFWQANKEDHVRSIGDFLADCRDGTLPAVSIVSPGVAAGAFSEEDRDIQRGESYSSLLINAVMDSPNWGSTVMFFTYDEHGGEYDHVAPPAAITPDDIPPRITSSDEPGGFDMYGIRVPSIVISPFAKAGYVSSVVHDHTSILRFIETKFNLGALTRRDANASDLLDTLDFEAKAFADPPELPAPALPDAKSACDPDGPPLPTATERSNTTTTTTTTTSPGGGTGSGGTASPATPVSGSSNYTG